MHAARILAVALLSTPLSQTGSPAPDPKLIRVYVHTDGGGEASELRDRQDTVKDISSWLADKKKDVVIVASEDGADVIVEVIQRWFSTPRVVMGVGGGRQGINPPPPSQIAHVRAEFRHARKTTSITNKNEPLLSNRGWKAAADDVAKQIHKWMMDNREAIVAAR